MYVSTDYLSTPKATDSSSGTNLSPPSWSGITNMADWQSIMKLFRGLLDGDDFPINNASSMSQIILAANAAIQKYPNSPLYAEINKYLNSTTYWNFTGGSSLVQMASTPSQQENLFEYLEVAFYNGTNSYTADFTRTMEGLQRWNINTDPSYWTGVSPADSAMFQNLAQELLNFKSGTLTPAQYLKLANDIIAARKIFEEKYANPASSSNPIPGEFAELWNAIFNGQTSNDVTMTLQFNINGTTGSLYDLANAIVQGKVPPNTLDQLATVLRQPPNENQDPNSPLLLLFDGYNILNFVPYTDWEDPTDPSTLNDQLIYSFDIDGGICKLGGHPGGILGGLGSTHHDDHKRHVPRLNVDNKC